MGGNCADGTSLNNHVPLITMDPTFAALLGGVIGAIIGGAASLSAAWLTSGRQHALEVEKRTLGKLEDIYRVAARLAHQGGISFSWILGHLNDGRPFKKDDMGLVDTPQLRMLIGFYAPSLRDLGAEMEGHWLELGKLFAETIGSRGKGRDIELVSRAKTLNAAITKTAETIEQSIAEMAQSISGIGARVQGRSIRGTDEVDRVAGA